jgi:FAD/FMN-containing dehydrogenase/Fe-S oxidoreductase
MATATASPQPPAFAEALRHAVRGDVFVDATRRGIYATDASHYQMMPLAAVVPRDEADVAAVIRLAREHGVAITGRGAGTSLAGQTFGTGIVLDFSKHMNSVLEVDERQKWACVQPGIVRDQLNRRLQPMKLHFAPDPATSSRATVGGMIANNSSGTRSVVYGKTIDHVIALKVMLSDGSIHWFEAGGWAGKAQLPGREGELYCGVERIVRNNADEIARRFPKVMRRVGGYNLDEFPVAKPVSTQADVAPQTDAWNLSKLIVGSEGTLGLVLEAKIRLTPLPGATALCVVHFHDLIESLRCVPAMLEHKPSTVELLDDSIINEATVNPSSRGFADFFEGAPAAVQIVEFMGDTQAQADDRARCFAAEMRQRGIGYAHVLRHEVGQIANVWELRRLGVGLQSNVKGRKKPLDFVDDACVPVERLAEYIQRLRDVCRGHGVAMPVCAHASVGVLHPKPMLDLHDPEDVRKMRQIADAAFEMVREYGGSWAGEHGDGLVRGEYIRPFFGDQIYEAFREVKRLFDPLNLMNPGKVLDTPPMTENLRHGVPGYERRLAEVHSNYQYREQGSFALAVEQCNGVGACRKLGSGTMCPSYMATLDEEATTRGRANALRLAMSGQLGDEGLAGDGVMDVMSLCLQCKACKTECPNAVDMSKLKSDVLQMRHDAQGVPLGSRLMGDSPRFAAMIAGPLAPLVNTVQSLGAYKWAMQRLAGIDRRRPYPRFARRTFAQHMRRRRKPRDGHPWALERVVLFNDTYVNFYEPHIGLRAVELLEGCGYEVIVANAGCCQRPRMSKGLVRDARRDGAVTMARLDAFVQQGLTIVCTEPSCCSALTDDLPDLIEDAEVGKRVSSRVKMLDVFLAEELAAGRLEGVRFTSPAANVLLHGHCHQKALFGTRGMKDIWARVPELLVSEVDSGCCGMAGSFGYEHHELSMKIGEERLFPAVRAVSERSDTAICANGFSCRHQVHDACGTMPRHWVELIRAERDVPGERMGAW